MTTAPRRTSRLPPPRRLPPPGPLPATSALPPSGSPPRYRSPGLLRALGAVLALALAGPAAALGDSIRCDGGLVSVGDTKLDLLGKCGAPTLLEREEKERASVRLDEAGRPVAGRAVAVQVERWTCNFGPRRFVQHVTLEAGVVTAVANGGYGYDLGPERAGAPAIPRARCDQLAFHEGDSTFDVLARCGEPAVRDEKVVTHTASTAGPGGGRVETVTGTSLVELWTYDLGPQALTRRLTIKGGRVVRVETGGYGYSR